MSFKNRNVRFWGLVALPALLLSGSIVGCSTQDVGIKVTLPGYVSGKVNWDEHKDGYDETDPPLPNDREHRKSMRLLDMYNNEVPDSISRTKEGYYVFIAPPGDYKVEASCPDYETGTKTVTIISDEIAKKNFGLKKVNP